MDDRTMAHLRAWMRRDSGIDVAAHCAAEAAMAAEWDAAPEAEREGLTWPMVLRRVTDRARGIGGDGAAFDGSMAWRIHCGRPEGIECAADCDECGAPTPNKYVLCARCYAGHRGAAGES